RPGARSGATLAGAGGRGLGKVVGGGYPDQGRAGPPRLDRERALRRRRHDESWIETLFDALPAIKAVEARAGDHKRVDLARVEAPQSRVDIAVQRQDAPVGTRGTD